MDVNQINEMFNQLILGKNFSKEFIEQVKIEILNCIKSRMYTEDNLVKLIKKYTNMYVNISDKQSRQEHIEYLKSCEEVFYEEADKKELIEHIGEYIDRDDKESTQEYIDYIKSFVEKSEISLYKLQLIQYMKNFITIENRQEYIDYVKKCVDEFDYEYYKTVLIELIGEYIDKEDKEITQEYIDYIKNCLKDIDGEDDKMELIQFMGEYIDKEDKQSREDYINYTKTLIKEYDENIKLELVKHIIEFEKGENEESIEYYTNYVKNLLKDKEVKDYMSAKKLIELPSEHVDKENPKDLAKYIEFVKECISDQDIRLSDSNKYYIIQNISVYMNSKNPENVKQYVTFLKNSITDQELMLTSGRKTDLIDMIGTFINKKDEDIVDKYVDYVKKCIEDKSLDLNDYFKKYLIEKLEIYVKDNEISEYMNYIKEYLENNSTNLKSYCKIDLIAHMKKCLQDKDTNGINEYLDFLKDYIVSPDSKFDNCEKMQLVENVKKYIKNEETKDKGWEVIKAIFPEKEEAINLFVSFMKGEQLEDNTLTDLEIKIDLPEKMTIGIEIESEGFIGEFLRGNLLDWKAKADGSIDGVEVVSPKLSGTENDSKKIFQICNILNGIEQTATEKCGGHIHIGADYLKSNDAYLILLELWSNAEKVLYQISNDAGELPREDALYTYAPPISKKIEDALEDGYVDLSVEKDFDYFVYDLELIQENDRYSGINFLNVGNYFKNTIEFRLSNGTLNAKTWIENINLFGRYCKVFTRFSRNI